MQSEVDAVENGTMISINKSKQECIPVGCVPPTLCHMGGLPGQRPPMDRDPHPLNSDPLDIVKKIYFLDLLTYESQAADGHRYLCFTHL